MLRNRAEMRKFLSFFCLLCVLSLSVSAQFYNSVGGSGVDIEGSGVDIEGSGGEGSAVGGLSLFFCGLSFLCMCVCVCVCCVCVCVVAE